MKGHQEIERILASYRDAPAEERARAHAHVAVCPACAARLAAFCEVDSALASMAQSALPASLARPLAAVIAERDRRSATRSAPRLAFARTLAPVAAVVILLAALSMFLWSLNSGRPPVTATPTLTTTLTPTKVSMRETEPAAFVRFAPASAVVARRAPVAEPTPLPVPEPTAGMSGILLAGYGAHATMIH
jgi:hypothetical protein